MRRHSTTGLLSLALMLGGWEGAMAAMPTFRRWEPPRPPEPTAADLERLAAAQAKRDRKAQKKAENQRRAAAGRQ